VCMYSSTRWFSRVFGDVGTCCMRQNRDEYCDLARDGAIAARSARILAQHDRPEALVDEGTSCRLPIPRIVPAIDLRNVHRSVMAIIDSKPTYARNP
jgi:hypothetical protein